MYPDIIATDGGVAGSNPSTYGGSWAYVYVTQKHPQSFYGPLFVDEGVYDQERDAWVVSNNVTELAAMVKALAGVRSGWYGRVISDSMLTLRRITNYDASMNGVPDWLAEETDRVRKHINLDRCIWQLVAGHPTQLDLVWGYRAKDYRPVSQWNQMADKLCTQQIGLRFPREKR